MEEIAAFFRSYAPVFTGLGAVCTATAALFSIAVAFRAMRKTDLEIKQLEKQLSSPANSQSPSPSFVGHWINSPKVNFLLVVLADTMMAALLLLIIQRTVSFFLADRDSDGVIAPLWWFLREAISTGAAFFLFWPVVRSLARFKASLLHQ